MRRLAGVVLRELRAARILDRSPPLRPPADALSKIPLRTGQVHGRRDGRSTLRKRPALQSSQYRRGSRPSEEALIGAIRISRRTCSTDAALEQSEVFHIDITVIIKIGAGAQRRAVVRQGWSGEACLQGIRINPVHVEIAVEIRRRRERPFVGAAVACGGTIAAPVRGAWELTLVRRQHRAEGITAAGVRALVDRGASWHQRMRRRRAAVHRQGAEHRVHSHQISRAGKRD